MYLIRKNIAVFIMVMACMAMLTSTACASDGGSTWDKVKDMASDAKDTIVENAPGIIESAKETGSELVDKAKEKGSEALETAKETQEAAKTLLQQQEDQFWGWFGNQINSGRSTSTSDDTTSPETSPEGAETSSVSDVPEVVYYDPNAITDTAVDADGNPVVAASGTSTATDRTNASVQDYPEENSSPSDTSSDSSTQGTASNELPQITPQPEAPENSGRSPSSLAEKMDEWMSVAIKIVIVVAILLLAAAGYLRISRL